MSATRRVYTKEYRVNAVKLAQDIGRDAAAKELGIPVGTIDNWLAAVRNGKLDMGPGSQTPETALTLAAKLKEAEREIHNLEVENRRLQRTNEILDKAARFFAASQEK